MENKEETTMELKIGQIFQHNKKWYQCVEGGDGCKNCAFYDKEYSCCDTLLPDYYCCDRSDGKDVIFKELEKVGEPYEFDGHIFQSYRTFEVPIFTKNYATVREFGNNSKISIEIKQNKEDMKEKKPNLKPFDLEAAKSGKPVCTRDGRKARIICFDSKNDPQRPIVALVEHNDNELLYEYTIEGKDRFSHIDTTGTSDLMMLSEKKEGWVNVYKRKNEYICENECSVSTGITVYKSESEAKRSIDEDKIYVNTIKITWEE